MKKEVAYVILIIFLFLGVLIYTNNRDRINFFSGFEDGVDGFKYDAPNFLLFMGIVLLVISAILVFISLFNKSS